MTLFFYAVNHINNTQPAPLNLLTRLCLAFSKRKRLPWNEVVLQRARVNQYRPAFTLIFFSFHTNSLITPGVPFPHSNGAWKGAAKGTCGSNWSSYNSSKPEPPAFCPRSSIRCRWLAYGRHIEHKDNGFNIIHPRRCPHLNFRGFGIYFSSWQQLSSSWERIQIRGINFQILVLPFFLQG